MVYNKMENSGIIEKQGVVASAANPVSLNKIQRLKKELIILKSQDKKTRKKTKMPKLLQKLLKKRKKKPGYVVVQYLTANYEIKFKLCKIISGNLVVVDNKVHKLNPDKIWRLNKDSCYILREIDRNPVSNDDYEQIRERGDDTDGDVPLIKAVLGAIQKNKSSEDTNKNTMVIIGVIAVVVVVAILLMK